MDVLDFDFTYSPTLVDVIASTGSVKTLTLGLADGRTTKLEDATTVASQLEKIVKRAEVTCAQLKPPRGLEYLPRDRAQLKLEHLGTIKKTFLGSSV